ncbi:Cas1p-domain-containing protein [Hesseltinella vesiculosa]|uniref:Cas1p-domain-containing protein n=1 Tax=Hesseltinella vesiculosa TaxID=101127 RepID=A0A1X2G4T3_9FUNG|nr:Cas1p-domain-containing protein [Hesseltinella vesiculosa]
MHTFKPTDAGTCLKHSRVLYIGDSIARQQFFAFADLMQPGVDTLGEKHKDHRFTFNDQDIVFEFWWDPFLNSTRTLDLFQSAGRSPLGFERPSLLVVASGMWHMRYLESSTFYNDWRVAVDRLIGTVERTNQLADAVILSPVEIPQFHMLAPNRSAITMEKVVAMNGYLKSRQQQVQPKNPFAIPFVWNKIIDGSPNATDDGLHYNPEVTSMQVQLALNYRCNDVLPKHFPYDATCCMYYPRPHWYQNIFFLFFLLLIPIGFYLSDAGFTRYIPSEKVLNACFIFGLGVIYLYFGDRTQIFGKMHKHYDAQTFTVLMVLFVVVAGLASLKTTKKEGADLGFLNRDQTDEWKGWMQIIILIYHFVGASGTSGIYNAVRVLVAAYLFQTGYGHFFFFYKKDDFGLPRVLNVLVRLNLLTFVLQYLMDTDYLSYYFTPLVTFWFGVIYFTMWIGHGKNKHTGFLLTKLVVAALATTALIQTPGVMEAIFDLLHGLAGVEWNAKEWRFRLALDGWIVYVGMLSALAYIKYLEHKWMEHPRFGTVKTAALASSVFALLWYFWFELSRENKFVYNAYQPYVSWVPILAFVFLRNATVGLRNTSSRFFIFIGKISLETFIGQFHMWLAGDTRGLLIVLPDSSWVIGTSLGWYANLFVSTVIFVFVSYYLSQSTGELTRWICSDVILGGATDQQQRQRRQHAYQALPVAVDTAPPSSDAPGTEARQHIPPNAEHNNIPMDSLNAEDSDHDVSTSAPPSRLTKVISDPRVKVFLFIALVSFLNRFK